MWCEKMGGGRGPSYGTGTTKVSVEAYEELYCYRGDEYAYDGTIYKVRVLEPQRKGDGRGAQGNIQLFSAGKMAVNLHVTVNLNPPPVITKATDGGGDWSTPQKKIRVKGK